MVIIQYANFENNPLDFELSPMFFAKSTISKMIGLTLGTLYQETNSRQKVIHSLKILFFVEGFDKDTKVLESLAISREHIQKLFFTIM